MAWTPQKTWTSEVLTASDLNTYLRDDMEYLKAIADGVAFSAVRVTRAASTSIADSTSTPITWTAEGYDYGGWWTSGTDIIVPAGAVPSGFTTIAVDIFGRTQFASNSTGARKYQVMLNGSLVAGPTVPGVTGGDSTEVLCTHIEVVEAGDVITVELYQTSTGSLNATNTQIIVARRAPAS